MDKSNIWSSIGIFWGICTSSSFSHFFLYYWIYYNDRKKIAFQIMVMPNTLRNSKTLSINCFVTFGYSATFNSQLNKKMTSWNVFTIKRPLYIVLALFSFQYPQLRYSINSFVTLRSSKHINSSRKRACFTYFFLQTKWNISLDQTSSEICSNYCQK